VGFVVGSLKRWGWNELERSSVNNCSSRTGAGGGGGSGGGDDARYRVVDDARQSASYELNTNVLINSPGAARQCGAGESSAMTSRPAERRTSGLANYRRRDRDVDLRYRTRLHFRSGLITSDLTILLPV